MYKNLTISAYVGEWKLPRVQETFSCKTTSFKMDPSAKKLQVTGNKQNKAKENDHVTITLNFNILTCSKTRNLFGKLMSNPTK